MRIALGIEYNGTNYHGWQIQPNLSTVQLQVESALSKIANHSVNITCAGRTDVGVHAFEQVVHFDSDAIRQTHSWFIGANNYLPPDIRVQWAKVVTNDFHARFSALSRSYRYFIYNKPINSAHYYRKATWYPRKLNVELMHEAGQFLLGEHDFSSFRGTDCQSKSTKRCVTLLSVKRNNSMIVIDIKANAFLMHMVRNIVGVLIAIGIGKKPPIWAKEVLLACDRKVAAVTASAEGLYFMHVEYPEKFGILTEPVHNL